MAKKQPKDEAAKYLEGVLAKVPEDKRAAVREALGVDAILEDLGAHILRQEDYSKLANEAEEAKKQTDAKYKENVDWYKVNLPKLAEGEALAKERDDLKAKLEAAAQANAGDPDEDTISAALKKVGERGYLTRAEAEKTLAQTLAQRESDFVGFSLALNNISMQHYVDYKEKLDTVKLVKLAREAGKSLDVTYAEMSADLREAKQEATAKEHEAALEKKIREKLVTEMSARGPYPTPDSSEDISPLSGMGKKGKPEYGVEAAVALFNSGQLSKQ